MTHPGAGTAAPLHAADGKTVTWFDAATADEVRELLGACLDVQSWVAAVEEGRPYRDRDRLLATADQAAAALGWEDVAGALSPPPANRRASGSDGPDRT